MSRSEVRRIFIREVVEHLGVSPETMRRLKAEGLFETDSVDAHEAEELRVAAVLIEELGVNAPGVQVALRLRRRLFALESRVNDLATRLDRTDLERRD